MHETASSNLELWKEVGDPIWLQKWVEDKGEDWPEAMELLALYY